MIPKKYEQGSCLFWMAVGLVVTVSSLQLKLGNLTEPGPGFMPLLAGLFLILLGLGHLAETLFSKAGQEEPLWKEKTWWKVILTLASLWAYAMALPLAGFLVATSLLMVLLFKVIESLRWPLALLATVLSVALSYGLFTLLGAEFP
ncbi:MAG: tripartite tricarboxylate transporter TctB family protein, partial [Deltaproteobacteria bacterium]